MHPIHLCIGAPVSGMSWLYENMRQLPTVFVPEVREVRYWNSRRSDAQRDANLKGAQGQSRQDGHNEEQAAWLARWAEVSQSDPVSIEGYINLMSVSDRPSLDISPTYCYLSPEQVKELRAGLPEGSKVIYFMSDPLERLEAQAKLHFYQQRAYRGAPSSADLTCFLRSKGQQLRWDYAAVLDYWRNEFQDDFIHFAVGEGDDCQDLLDRVQKSLDLAPAPEATTASGTLLERTIQSKQPSVASLGPSERKLLAQHLLPDLERVANRIPRESKPWLAKLRRQVTAQVSSRQPIEDTGTRTQTLMRMTESLGENCEYGFWQRHRGYEPSSLFRWAITPIDSLLSFLETPGPLFAAADLSVHSPGMVSDASYGFKFHSKLVERDAEGATRLLDDPEAFEEIFKAEAAKIAHLKDKFFAQLKRQTGLYIIKDNKGLSEEKARQVLSLLRKHNPSHHLLWVEQGSEPSIVDLGDGLLGGHVPNFAPYVSADSYHPDGWTRLMSLACEQPAISNQIDNMQR